MNFRIVESAGDNPHRFGVLPVFSDGFDAAFAGHDHPVPGKQHVMIEGPGKVQVNFGHHLRETTFCGRDAARILDKFQSQLLPQRRLNALPVEIFSFDGGGLQCFFADQVDPDLVAPSSKS